MASTGLRPVTLPFLWEGRRGNSHFLLFFLLYPSLLKRKEKERKETEREKRKINERGEKGNKGNGRGFIIGK